MGCGDVIAEPSKLSCARTLQFSLYVFSAPKRLHGPADGVEVVGHCLRGGVVVAGAGGVAAWRLSQREGDPIVSDIWGNPQVLQSTF